MDDAGNSGFHLFFEKKMKIIRNKKLRVCFMEFLLKSISTWNILSESGF